ncbi:hypothetical protein DdX_15165 [Ditylenchus destructor]|uniref:Uncharacterized protein n=1 Tax=Ditylenchus destructor TaxID=166010 RepID=A0AAD4R195_9BILA|nr:hypothetical protein DdX_15165 [Ditylenchus destructor]
MESETQVVRDTRVRDTSQSETQASQRHKSVRDTSESETQVSQRHKLVRDINLSDAQISQKERLKTTTVDLTLTISYPIYIARRRRRRASPVVGRGAPDPPPWNVRELRTYTPEQPLLPNNNCLRAEGPK